MCVLDAVAQVERAARWCCCLDSGTRACCGVVAVLQPRIVKELVSVRAATALSAASEWLHPCMVTLWAAPRSVWASRHKKPPPHPRKVYKAKSTSSESDMPR